MAIMQKVPINSGNQKRTFNHTTDMKVADKGSAQLNKLDSVGRRYFKLSK